MPRSLSYAIAFALCILLIPGCKKNLDELSPRIKFISPYAGSQYSVLDYVDVAVEITDETAIDWVHVDIVKANNVQIAGAQQMSFSGSTNETIEVGILLENIHIESDTYYIRVRAYDGTNEHVSFREIQVSAVPLEVLGILVYSPISASNLEISQVSGGDVNVVANWDSDFSFGASNSYHQEIAFAGEELDGVSVLDVGGFTLLHTEPSFNNTDSPFYHDFFFNYGDLRYYAITRDGQIQIYRPGGTLQQTIQTQINQRPYHLLVTNNKLLTEERNWSGSQQYINQYYKGSGALEASIALPFALVAIVETNDGIQLFGYDGDELKTMQYYTSTYAMSSTVDVGDLGIGTVHSVVRIEGSLNEEAFVLCGDGGMKAITVNIVQSNVVASWSQGGSHVEINQATGELLVLSNGELLTYAWSSSNPTSSVSVGSDAADFSILYNK
jgi:hypothetical protein